MRDAELRSRIRELLSSGRLPRQLPAAAQRDPTGAVASSSIRVGLQAGEHCVVCGEAQPMVTYTYPDGRVIRLHSVCDTVWHEEMGAAAMADEAPQSVGSHAERPRAADALARILVVDDQPELAELFQVFLEGEGHAVDAVHSGEAALERLARHRYALVVCDLQMPDVDGVAVSRAVEQLVPPRPAVLLMTGYADTATYSDFLQTTDAVVLTKPVGLDALRAHAQRLLAQR